MEPRGLLSEARVLPRGRCNVAHNGTFNTQAEAWLGKIVPTLQKAPRHNPWTPWSVPPRSELITMPRADGVDGGAIFVQQLSLDGAAAGAAMMIGIHRLPQVLLPLPFL